MSGGLQKSGLILRILFVRLRFLFVFLAVGLVVGNWRWIMNVVDALTRGKAETHVQGEFEYYCPMHPNVVRQDDREKCPICGMPLSKRRRGEKAALPEGVIQRVQLSPTRVAQAGLATEEVMYRPLVREIRTVGAVEWDETRVKNLSAWIAGRADELIVNFTGVRVKQGDPVYRLYSPDLVTTQDEYLLALKGLKEVQESPTPDPGAVGRASRLAAAARERLKLWGIPDEEVATLEKEGKSRTHVTIASPVSGVVIRKAVNPGQYVSTGEQPYTVADDSVVWLQTEVFERDLGLVKEGQLAEVATEAYPGERFEGRIAFIQPELQTSTRTVKARVEIQNGEGKLKAGMYATAVIRVPLGRRGKVSYVC